LAQANLAQEFFALFHSNITPNETPILRMTTSDWQIVHGVGEFDKAQRFQDEVCKLTLDDLCAGNKQLKDYASKRNAERKQNRYHLGFG
jgi:hypothetical protein